MYLVTDKKQFEDYCSGNGEASDFVVNSLTEFKKLDNSIKILTLECMFFDASKTIIYNYDRDSNSGDLKCTKIEMKFIDIFKRTLLNKAVPVNSVSFTEPIFNSSIPLPDKVELTENTKKTPMARMNCIGNDLNSSKTSKDNENIKSVLTYSDSDEEEKEEDSGLSNINIALEDISFYRRHIHPSPMSGWRDPSPVSGWRDPSTELRRLLGQPPNNSLTDSSSSDDENIDLVSDTNDDYNKPDTNDDYNKPDTNDVTTVNVQKAPNTYIMFNNVNANISGGIFTMVVNKK